MSYLEESEFMQEVNLNSTAWVSSSYLSPSPNPSPSAYPHLSSLPPPTQNLSTWISPTPTCDVLKSPPTMILLYLWKIILARSNHAADIFNLHDADFFLKMNTSIYKILFEAFKFVRLKEVIHIDNKQQTT